MPQSPEVIVRDRNDDDLEDAARALVEVHRVDGYPVEGVAHPVAWLQPVGLLHAWVGVLNGRVVGHAVVTEPKPGDAAVDTWVSQGGELARIAVGGRLFVHPNGRGHQLGHQLASTLTEWATSHGYDLVGDVMEKDHAALRLYRALGWQQIGSAMHDTGHGTEVPALLFVHTAPRT